VLGFSKEFHINGKFRAQEFAIMTVQAPVGFHDHGRMVAFFVEFLGKTQHFPGAEFNAVPAALAAIFNDMDLAPDNIDLARVQGLPPVFHKHTFILCLLFLIERKSLSLLLKISRGKIEEITDFSNPFRDTPIFFRGVSRFCHHLSNNKIMLFLCYYFANFYTQNNST